MKIFLRQDLLLLSFCYDSEKYFINMIRMKTFLRENLMLVSFGFLLVKNVAYVSQG